MEIIARIVDAGYVFDVEVNYVMNVNKNQL